MADKLQIELVGADDLLAKLSTAAAKLERPRELLFSIGEEIRGNVERRFQSKQDASGAAWAQLSPATKAIYDAKGIGGTLLERSGYMRESLSANATDNYVEVGFGMPYAIYHVTGTRKMPRRDPLFGLVNTDGTQGELGAHDAQDVLDLVEGFLGDALA